MFSESLKLNLKLNIKGETINVPGANVKKCRLELHNYGFEGHLVFWAPSDQRKDDLFTKFASPDLIGISLGINAVYNMPDPAPDPIEIKGLVTEKSVKEIFYPGVKKNPVLYRKYEVYFKDPAQVLWTQHFPSDLVVKTTMKDVIESQVVEGISIEMDWDILTKQRPMICLGLGAQRNEASFYDFLISFISFYNGVMIYDYKNNKYKIKGEKEIEGQPGNLGPEDIEVNQIKWFPVFRNNIKMRNGLAEGPVTEPIIQEQAVEGINKEILVRIPVQDHFTSLKTLETNKLKVREFEVEVDLKKYPELAIVPGSLVRIKSSGWGDKMFILDKEFRTYNIVYESMAVDQNPENDIDCEFTQYNTHLTTMLEQKAGKWIHLPEFRKPSYPVFAEGKIICEVGDDPDKTYQIEKDSNTSQDQYRIKIPLWDKEIRILFECDYLNPHFYFPFYRDIKLLIGLNLFSAYIDRVLEWGPRVRLPHDTQGNHILFGKDEKDETSMRHIYEDNKPVLSIKRVLENDTELVRMEEGLITIQTKEEE